MVDTDDTRRTTDNGRRTTPRVWHKLPTGELKMVYDIFYKSKCAKIGRAFTIVTGSFNMIPSRSPIEIYGCIEVSMHCF